MGMEVNFHLKLKFSSLFFKKQHHHVFVEGEGSSSSMSGIVSKINPIVFHFTSNDLQYNTWDTLPGDDLQGLHWEGCTLADHLP